VTPNRPATKRKGEHAKENENARMDDSVRVDFAQWSGRYARGAPGSVLSQNRQFHFRDAFSP
jgi:hypothetical protein